MERKRPGEHVGGGKIEKAERAVETGEMKAYLARQSKNGTKVENRVQKAVHLSLRVEDGRGSQCTEGEGDG